MRTRLRRKTPPVALAALGLAFGAAAQMPAPSNPASGSPHAASPTDTRMGGTSNASADTAAGTNHAKSKLSHADRKFIENAAKGGMGEVELGKVAQERAADQQVKQFAAKMVQDHSKANEKLRQLAQEKGVTLPADTTFTEKHEANKLAKLEGTNLDREYMKHMVKDHKKDVKEFRRQAQKAKDPDVKSFAQSTLPVLQEHLQLAENTDAAVSGKSGTSKR